MTAPLYAGARAGLPDSVAALRRIVEAAAALDIRAEPAARPDAHPDAHPAARARAVTLRGDGWSVGLDAGDRGLDLAAEACDAVVMRGIKEMAVHFLAEIDPPAAEALRWSDGARPGALAADFQAWTWRGARAPVMPGLDRLVFEVEDAARYAGAPMHVRLLVPPVETGDGEGAAWPRQKPNGGLAWPAGPQALATRVYTVRRADVARGEVEIDAVVHGDDLLAGWAARARPGWRLGALGPSGGPPAADAALMAAADLCALPALARAFEAAPGRRGLAVVAAPPEAAAYLAPPPGIALRLLPPDTAPEALADALLDAAEAAMGAADPPRWWIAAETAAVRRARVRLDALGVPRDRRDCVAYWRA